MSQVTVRKAAQLTGKSRETINAATKDGTLSFTLNGRGHKVIDVSELERVFPLIKTLSEIDPSDEPVRTGQKVSDRTVREELGKLLERLQHREEVNETQRLERERERRQLQEEIEHLRATLEKAQEQHRTALLLLTDQRTGKGSEQDDLLGELRDQINAQKVWFEERENQIKNEARQDTLQEIRSESWLELAFGNKLRA